MAFYILYVTHPSLSVARKITESLINKKLIGCGNIFPINSIFSWKGKIKNAKEYVSILKTSLRKVNNTIKEIKKIHPYDVPCIIKIRAKANKEYEEWLINLIR